MWVQEFLQLGFRWHRYHSQRGAAGGHGWFLTNFLINLLKIREGLIGAEDCAQGTPPAPALSLRVCVHTCGAELGKRGMASASHSAQKHSCCCHLPSLFWEKEFSPLAWKFKRLTHPLLLPDATVNKIPSSQRACGTRISIFGFVQAGVVT